MRIAALLFFVLFAFSIKSFGQSTEIPVFSNINFGAGIIYGGVGLNGEIGLADLSLYGSFGYAPKSFADSIEISPTFNRQIGFRFYPRLKSDIVFPRLGVGFGWITNYYNDNIGSKEYDQSATGLSFSVGAQFYTVENITVSIDFAFSSTIFLTNRGRHPFFYDFYIRPAIGVGYDITAIFKRGKKSNRLQNKSINPTG